MHINEYSSLIKKQFQYLFKKYGFKIVHTEEYRPGYSWFHIGLESKICRILFAREQGGGIMFLGPVDAPFNNEDDEKWVAMLNLLSYLVKKKWDWSFLDELPQNERVIAWLSFNAKELEPHCDQILEMFHSQELISEWMPGYKEYLKEKVR